MEDILKTIIENLVDEKDKVEISRVDDEKGVLLKVKSVQRLFLIGIIFKK